jgi:hypothetical protein
MMFRSDAHECESSLRVTRADTIDPGTSLTSIVDGYALAVPAAGPIVMPGPVGARSRAAAGDATVNAPPIPSEAIIAHRPTRRRVRLVASAVVIVVIGASLR